MTWKTAMRDLAREFFTPWNVRETPGAMPPGLVPPVRGHQHATVETTLTLSSAYRAMHILATAASQLPITVEAGGKLLDSYDIPALVRNPSLRMSRTQFVQQAVLSLAGTGNLFILNERGVQLTILPADQVGVYTDDMGRVTYGYNGRTYTYPDMQHQMMMPLPGATRGLGPIQAARLDLQSALDTRAYAATWFSQTGEPAGLLKATSDKLTPEQAKQWRDAWNAAAADPNNATRIRVVGAMDYQSLLIKPQDAQWLESQKFSTTQVARLFGVPGSLMMTAPDGNGQSYANVEQELTSFAKFTLMDYLTKIEDVLTRAAPAGQRVKFNLEGLLRGDTSSRYIAYQRALTAGWMTADEVRAKEGLPPLSPKQLESMANAKTPAAPITE